MLCRSRLFVSKSVRIGVRLFVDTSKWASDDFAQEYNAASKGTPEFRTMHDG
jgi:hypothetical protein